MSELLQCLIAFRLFVKRVEYISEEERDADGIYVVLQVKRWGRVPNTVGRTLPNRFLILS
jgi:hypothetical protein